ncbi:unnamed protein product [Linum tenue]|uniref:Uncharacterized protein n=1 Tax=Linum tenue TaxID=586396 RepID=A0AAV0MDG5_9ROSI|nr:unnamed protein product [Linum tenue]
MRLAPPLQGGFRKAMTDFIFNGFFIPKSWKVRYLCVGTYINMIIQFPVLCTSYYIDRIYVRSCIGVQIQLGMAMGQVGAGFVKPKPMGLSVKKTGGKTRWV